MKTAADPIAALAPWFHNLHLPGGAQTAPDHPLGDFPAFKWNQIAPHLPADLTGWRALDIGCNAGFYSFELARRGARVTGIDPDPRYLAQARWAAAELGLDTRITFRQMQVYELAGEARPFDLVLFIGVFYHLRYPLLALDIVRRSTRRHLLFQSLSLPGRELFPNAGDPARDLAGLQNRAPLLDPGWPKMAFIEHSFAGDPTNWWIPNHAAIEALLRSSGFKILSHPTDETYWCETAPIPYGVECVGSAADGLSNGSRASAKE